MCKTQIHSSSQSELLGSAKTISLGRILASQEQWGIKKGLWSPSGLDFSVALQALLRMSSFISSLALMLNNNAGKRHELSANICMFCDDKVLRSTIADDAPQASLLLVESKVDKVADMVAVDDVA